MRRGALGAVAAQAVQAGASFVLQVLVVRLLGIEELGRFAILYGVLVLATGVVTGVIGDSLVVLDRADPRIRSALQSGAVGLAALSGAVPAGVALAAGLVTPVEAVAFAGACALFTLEEVLRRLLMAGVAFFRIVAADLAGFVVALGVIGVAVAGRVLDLAVVLGAIAAGQGVAILVAVALLPRGERRIVAPRTGGFGAVLRYGSWRGLQQLLRPGLLTGVRSLVGVAAGLAAVGLLETARVYVAPALLLIGGLSSFLFVAFARDRDGPLAPRRRRADRAVLVLLSATGVMSLVGLALLPWAGPLLFGVQPDVVSVLGWLAYAASVAAVTPYGSLAATRGRQARVFAIRASDTVAGLAGVAVLLVAGGPPAVAPLVLAATSLAGGLGIRFLVLREGPGRDPGTGTSRADDGGAQ